MSLRLAEVKKLLQTQFNSSKTVLTLNRVLKIVPKCTVLVEQILIY